MKPRIPRPSPKWLKTFSKKTKSATERILSSGVLTKKVVGGTVSKMYKKALSSQKLQVLKSTWRAHGKKVISKLGSKAVTVLLDEGLVALLVAQPELTPVALVLKELGILDTLKTLDVTNMTVDTRKLKFPLAVSPSARPAGDVNSTRVKLSALFTGAARIDPALIARVYEEKLGIKPPKQLNAAIALLGFLVAVLQSAPFVLIKGFQGHGFHFPGSNYIGPGTKVDSAGPPTGPMDSLARTHDIHYSYLETQGVDVYKSFNLADRYMLARVKLDTPEGWAVLIGINAKRVFKEDRTPIPPIPSYETVAAQSKVPQDQAWLLNNPPTKLLTEDEVLLRSGSTPPHIAHEDVGHGLSPETVVLHQSRILARPHPHPRIENARLTHIAALASHILKKT